jgi:hypothetical protein
VSRITGSVACTRHRISRLFSRKQEGGQGPGQNRRKRLRSTTRVGSKNSLLINQRITRSSRREMDRLLSRQCCRRIRGKTLREVLGRRETQLPNTGRIFISIRPLSKGKIVVHQKEVLIPQGEVLIRQGEVDRNCTIAARLKPAGLRSVAAL